MKTVIRILSGALALAMLFVSVGFSLSVHYCNGNVVSYAVNKQAKVCFGQVQLDYAKSGCSIKKPNCCENADWLFVLDTDAIFTDFDFEFPSTFIQNYSFSLESFVSPLSITEVHFPNAPPELRKHSLNILFQAFLI